MRIRLIAVLLLALASSIDWLVVAQERKPPQLTGNLRIQKETPPSTHDTDTSLPADDDIIRVDTNLVTVPVGVLDRNGRYIIDLKKEDFHILEDGIEQEVAFFAPVDQPFTILFLLDTSPSMAYRMAELADAANLFLKELRPDDKLIALSFCESVTVMCEQTKVSDLLDSKTLRLRMCPHTLIYDAVDEAFKRIRKVASHRKAVILFSDGYGGGIFASAKSNLRTAEELDALVYTIQYDTLLKELPADVNRQTHFARVEEGNNYMKALPQKTGGRYFQADSVSDWSRTFAEVADELRRQYTLGYYPKSQLKAGERRAIRVKVNQPGVVVRARDELVVSKNRLRVN